MKAEIDKLRGFTRPDSSASGMFFFQNCGSVARISSDAHHIWRVVTYLDCIPHDGLTVLDNEPKLREVRGKRQ
jgi:pullulanase/glycogen debranching enzyme